MSLENTAPQSLYSPLTEEDEIRLLELQPGSARDDIGCTLRHAKLSDQPAYEALSYEWGSDLVTKDIRVNDTVHKVRENLWTALIHLRLESEPRILWIDALCIHQDETLERSHQVNQMGAIYSQAQRVIAWLGREDEASTTAFRLFAQAAQGPVRLTESQHGGRRDMMEIPTTQELENLRQFCSRPYWSRLWIVQELLLAHDVTIQCGRQWTDWTNMYTIVTLFNECISRRAQDSRTTLMMRIINSLPSRLCREWQILKKSRPASSQLTPSWAALCTSYGRTCFCQDIKDKILALRSLAPKCCQEALLADYSLTLEALCIALLRHEFLRHPTFDVYDARDILLILELEEIKNNLHDPLSKDQIIMALESIHSQNKSPADPPPIARRVIKDDRRHGAYVEPIPSNTTNDEVSQSLERTYRQKLSPSGLLSIVKRLAKANKRH